MAEQRDPEKKTVRMDRNAASRIYGEDAEGITVEEPSAATDAEAVRILKEQGVDAYRRHVAGKLKPKDD